MCQVYYYHRFGYPREIAERIAEYWRKRQSFAEYQLIEVESTPNTGLQADTPKAYDIKPSMKKGFRFPREECPYCHQSIAENWLVKHIKSNCKVG